MQLELPLPFQPRIPSKKQTPFIPQKDNGEPRLLLDEWHALHPEFTDAGWTEAMAEIKEYLKLAWTVYRQQHPDLNLPEEL